MKLSEFKAGMRVFVKQGDKKFLGRVANAWGSDPVDIYVRFDSGQVARITEQSAHLFEQEVLS